jgi:hypothetical protein
MTRVFILFMLLLSLSPVSLAGMVTIENADDELLVGKSLEIVEDPTTVASLDDIRKRTDWIVSETDQPNFGFSQSAWWARFSLSVNSDRETQWYLQVDDAILNQIDVFIIRKKQQIHFKGGGWSNSASRHVPYRTHLFKLPLRTGESYQIYIRIRSELAVVLPVRLIDANKLTEIITEDVWVYGLYFGSMTAMLLFNAFVWLRMPRMDTLLYCAFSLCMIIVALCFCGFGKLFLWREMPHADNYIFTLMLAVDFLIFIPLFSSDSSLTQVI